MTYEAKVRPWLLIVLGAVIIVCGIYTYWNVYHNKGVTTQTSPTPTISAAKKSPTVSPTVSPTSSTSPQNVVYSNDKYDFTLTFPSAWKDYKIKEAKFEGEEATYYINMPTTDSTATGDSTADTGYFSPFAISVYTLDQWNQIAGLDAPIGTLITKNDTYAFVWSHANGEPPNDWTKENDINTIIASFKLK